MVDNNFFHLIMGIIGLFCTFVLLGFLANTIYTVTVGVYRNISVWIKLNYIGMRVILFGIWLSLLIVSFFPDHIYLRSIACIGALLTLIIIFGVLYYMLLIAVGVMTTVYLKNGEVKTYLGRYSSDNENYYFQKKRKWEAINKDNVERIEHNTCRHAYIDLIKTVIKIDKNNREKGKKGFLKSFIYTLFMKYDIAIVSIIFTFITLTFIF